MRRVATLSAVAVGICIAGYGVYTSQIRVDESARRPEQDANRSGSADGVNIRAVSKIRRRADDPTIPNSVHTGDAPTPDTSSGHRGEFLDPNVMTPIDALTWLAKSRESLSAASNDEGKREGERE